MNRATLGRGLHGWIGILLVLLLLGGAVASQAGGAQAAPAAATFGPNVRVNEAQTDQQQEPSLAVNPKDPRMLISAAKDWRSGTKEVWHYRSTDGGVTWADSHLPGLPADLPNQSDPVVVYDADGVAYTVVIAYDQEDLTKGGLFVARSTDNGATWSTPVLANGNTTTIFDDKEWLAVDRGNTPSRGTLYLTWTRFTTLNSREDRGDIVASTSTDGGATWSAPVTVSRAADQDTVQGSFPAVGPAGDLNVLYYDESHGAELWVARSTNQGRSFGAPVRAATVSPPPRHYPNDQFRMFVLPALTINPLDGTLVVTWGDYAGNGDVKVVVSRDGNRTWSAPVRVNDDSGANDQFFPTAVFDEAGLLHIAWLDRRDDPANATFTCYYTQSADNGRTFARSVRLGDDQSDPDVGFGGTLIGDYIQVDATAGRAWVAWVDTRTGDQNIYSSHVTGRLDTLPVPATTVTPGPTASPAPGQTPTPLPQVLFVDPAFVRVWERSDRPVVRREASRPWMWGPEPFAAVNEPYAQGKDGHRLVQYLDKARMEINHPEADRSQPWFVTNGLLVVEMMTGQVQVGDDEYDPRTLPPNTHPVAGDFDSPEAPSYAALVGVASLHGDNRTVDRTGQPVTSAISRTGVVSAAPSIPGASAVTYARYEPVLGHNVPNVFEAFMHQQGPIYQNGALVTGPVVDPLFDLGYPITEAYWARLHIGGQDTWALVQAYQRRVLTYVPSNAPPWRVEMGNVGRHYYYWRYGPGGGLIESEREEVEHEEHEER
ncbi:MAG TPA: sialidase family protein [Chloroflexia bacterium]|nr:sialidase family protein [Chloroflexia bacterium]